MNRYLVPGLPYLAAIGGMTIGLLLGQLGSQIGLDARIGAGAGMVLGLGGLLWRIAPLARGQSPSSREVTVPTLLAFSGLSFAFICVVAATSRM